MSTPTEIVNELYAAFGRGDLPFILSRIADNDHWSAEGPSELLFTGVHTTRDGVAQFFTGLAAQQGDPNLVMTEFLENGNRVAVFGRYQRTIKTTGKRVDTPVC